MQKEFVATCYIFEGNRTLLHFHKKLQRWLPPGGHVEENESPAEAARREVMEECGLEIDFIRDEKYWIEVPNASSFERPAFCLMENIPTYKDVPAHQHMDFVYMANPKKGAKIREGCGFEWFTFEEVEKLDLFPDVREVFLKVLGKVLV
ncbi:MAG: NUDIX domain-containing protein [Candidatus Algichlamydia australiensis]|nr:NUDIX domain-containing protein [Chlamydiales bacterium]